MDPSFKWWVLSYNLDKWSWPSMSSQYLYIIFSWHCIFKSIVKINQKIFIMDNLII